MTNPPLAGRRLRSVRLPGNALVLGVLRAGEVVVPHGDTVLERGDMLMLVGSPESLREARPWLTYGVRTPAADSPTRGAYPANGKEEAAAGVVVVDRRLNSGTGHRSG